MVDGTGGHCRPRKQRLVLGSVHPHPTVGPKQQQRMATRMLSLSSTPTLAPFGLRTGWSEKSARMPSPPNAWHSDSLSRLPKLAAVVVMSEEAVPPLFPSMGSKVSHRCCACTPSGQP